MAFKEALLLHKMDLSMGSRTFEDEKMSPRRGDMIRQVERLALTFVCPLLMYASYSVL